MKLRIAVCLALLAGGIAPAAAADAVQGIDPGMMAIAELRLPSRPARGIVFLLSSGAGWREAEHDLADRLYAGGAAVVGIDLPAYLTRAAGADGADGACIYLVADIERISHSIARRTGGGAFHPPVVAGWGAGGALALDLLAQTPDATLGGVIALDPAPAPALARPLCTPARRIAAGQGFRYVLPAGVQPAPLEVIQTAVATADALARIRTLADGRVAHLLTRTGDAPGPALAASLDTALDRIGETAADLPIVVLPATATRDTLAIMVSGDGGWRDLDKSIATALQAQGVPVVGLDSLRYFWSRRSPQETARDIATIVAADTERFHVAHVLLAGYSFGADVLPAVFAALPPALQARVVQISLLGLSTTADWEITVTGWLGTGSPDATPTGPPLAALPAQLIQCFYGREEAASACPALAHRAEVIRTEGGHHFDGDYLALTRQVLAGLDRRLAALPAGSSPSRVIAPAGRGD